MSPSFWDDPRFNGREAGFYGAQKAGQWFYRLARAYTARESSVHQVLRQFFPIPAMLQTAGGWERDQNFLEIHGGDGRSANWAWRPYPFQQSVSPRLSLEIKGQRVYIFQSGKIRISEPQKPPTAASPGIGPPLLLVRLDGRLKPCRPYRFYCSYPAPAVDRLGREALAAWQTQGPPRKPLLAFWHADPRPIHIAWGRAFHRFSGPAALILNRPEPDGAFTLKEITKRVTGSWQGRGRLNGFTKKRLGQNILVLPKNRPIKEVLLFHLDGWGSGTRFGFRPANGKFHRDPRLGSEGLRLAQSILRKELSPGQALVLVDGYWKADWGYKYLPREIQKAPQVRFVPNLPNTQSGKEEPAIKLEPGNAAGKKIQLLKNSVFFHESAKGIIAGADIISVVEIRTPGF